jgi:hypothetical protein
MSAILLSRTPGVERLCRSLSLESEEGEAAEAGESTEAAPPIMGEVKFTEDTNSLLGGVEEDALIASNQPGASTKIAYAVAHIRSSPTEFANTSSKCPILSSPTQDLRRRTRT